MNKIEIYHTAVDLRKFRPSWQGRYTLVELSENHVNRNENAVKNLLVATKRDNISFFRLPFFFLSGVIREVSKLSSCSRKIPTVCIAKFVNSKTAVLFG